MLEMIVRGSALWSSALLRLEVLEEVLAGDADRSNRRLEPEVAEQALVLVGERIHRNDREHLPRIAEAEPRDRAGAHVEDRRLVGRIPLELLPHERIPDLRVGREAQRAVVRPLLGAGRTSEPPGPERDLAAPARPPP
jgi:hypothetical protein